MLSGSLVKREISPWRMACLKIDSGYDLTLTTAKDRILSLNSQLWLLEGYHYICGRVRKSKSVD